MAPLTGSPSGAGVAPDGAVKRPHLLIAACAGMFVFGIALVLLGTLFGLPEMRARLQLDLVRQGNLYALLVFGVFLATVVVGPLIDRFGNKAVLAISSVLVTLALAGVAFAHSFQAAVVYAVLLGIGGGGLNTSTNVLVSDVYGDDRGPMLNVLGIFFGVGALFIPLLASIVAARIAALILAAAAMSALCAIAYLLLHFPAAREAHSFSWREVVRVARYPGVLLFAFLLFFESGNEASLNGWTSTWTAGLGAPAKTATAILAAFQASMMAGRILAARLLRRVTEPRLVLASGLSAVIGCALMLAASSVPVMAAGVVLTGLSFAAIYPTTLAMAGDRYQRFSGTVFGVLFSIALLGGIAFPWGLGHVSDAFGVRSGIVLPLMGAAMICVMITVIGKRAAKTDYGAAGAGRK